MKSERIAKWDNIKCVMILCVVLGHCLDKFAISSPAAKSIYLFIYTFHMPVFIFIGGLFSKHAVREKRMEIVIQYLTIYLVMKLMEAATFFWRSYKIKFHFFHEDGPAWFGFAIACFLFFTMIIQDYNKKYVMVFAFLVGCLAGLDNHLGNHFVSMRICVFYPVFLAGFYMDPDRLRMNNVPKKYVILTKTSFAIALAGLFLFIAGNIDRLWKYKDFLKGKVYYGKMKLDADPIGMVLKQMDHLLMPSGKVGLTDQVAFGFSGVVLRAICYLFWAFVIVAVIMLATERRHIYTWLGKRSMSIFIWHNLFLETIVVLLKKMGLNFKDIFPNHYLLATFLLSLIITIMCAYLPDIRMNRNNNCVRRKSLTSLIIK